MKLLLASNNNGKLNELKNLFADTDINILSMNTFKIDSPAETAETFKGNALIKAKYSSEKTGLITLADDSGLSIVALDNAPGVYSARWADDGNFDVAFKKIQNLMGNNVTNNSKASFTCVLCLYFPGGKYEFFEGECVGDITFPPAGQNGFGYDRIFIPKGEHITFAQMEVIEKAKHSHRSIAINKLQNYLIKHQLKG